MKLLYPLKLELKKKSKIAIPRWKNSIFNHLRTRFHWNEVDLSFIYLRSWRLLAKVRRMNNPKTIEREERRKVFLLVVLSFQSKFEWIDWIEDRCLDFGGLIEWDLWLLCDFWALWFWVLKFDDDDKQFPQESERTKKKQTEAFGVVFL